MTTSAIRSDDLDSDLSLLNRVVARGKGASAIPTKEPTLEEIKKSKKFYSGANPELQPDAEYDYDKDSDLALLNTVKPKPETQKEKKQLSRADAFMEVIAKPIYHNLYNAVIEPAMALATGAQAGVVGPLTGLVAAARSGKFGTQEGVNIGKQQAENYAAQTTYQPRSEIGRQIVGAIGNVGSAVGPLPEAQVFQPLVSPAASQLGSQFNALRNARIEPVNAPVNLANTSKFQSGGSAAAMPENVLRGNIDAALAGVSPELENHIRSAHPQAVNIPALETRALEEKHGVHLTTGQRTGDTSRYAQEWNKRGETPELTEHFKSQPSQMAEAVEAAKQRHAPDIPSSADASELGTHEINALASKDKVRTDAISNAYKALQDENGGQFPIDITSLNSNIRNSLASNLKTNHLSPSIASDLGDFYKNPTFEAYEALRTNLANEMRSSSNGNARAAAYIVRDELEKLPIFGEGTGNPQAVKLKKLADNARALVRERAAVIKSNPAYRAAIKEASDAADASAQGESINAAKFHNKYVSSATPEAIRRMKAEIPENDIAHQAIAHGELERVRNAITNANATRVKSDTFSDFLKKNTPVLREALPPEALQDVAEIGLLNSKIGKPDAGTFNHSNTFSGALAEMAKEGLSNAAETKLALLTKGASIPVVGGAKMMWQKHNKNAFAREAMNPHGGLVNENAVPRIEISGVPTGQ